MVVLCQRSISEAEVRNNQLIRKESNNTDARYAQLLEQKRATYPAYRKARTEMQEYLVAQKVAAVLLEKEKEQAAMDERRKEEQRTDPHR